MVLVQSRNIKGGYTMENNNTQTYEIRDVLSFIERDLAKIAIPASILAALQPEQIMLVKQLVIDPIENSRRNLGACIEAYDRSRADEEMRKAEEEGKVVDLGEINMDEDEDDRNDADKAEDSSLRSE